MTKITTSEFAKLLKMSRAAFLAKVRRGEIVPINKDDWQIDGEYLFTAEEVERVKEQYKKPGLTIREVAERLNISQARVYQLMRREKDPLQTVQHFYNGKNRHFVTEEEFQSFKQRTHFNVNLKKNMVSKKHDFYLFQLFMNDRTNEYARIMEIDHDGQGIAITEGDRKLSLDQLSLEGFQPVNKLKRKKFMTTKGYVKFRFPLPHQIKAKVFTILDELYKEAGVENLRISVQDEQIEVEVKPIVLPDTSFDKEDIFMLQNHVVDGNVSVRANGSIRLQSDLVSIHAFVPSLLKESIRERAKQLNLTMEEFVIQAIQKELDSH